MGCMWSGTVRHDDQSRIFRVYNVDDQGMPLNPGKIEVGDTDLILYQKSKEPIRWPLRCLRRYGFDAELFSFESGRRCPTGPGIYAFKCRCAEALFNLVQECIQRVGQEDQNRSSQNMLSSSSRPNSRPTSTIDTREVNGFLVPSTGHTTDHHIDEDLTVYVNGSILPVEEAPMHNYINTGNLPTSYRIANGIIPVDNSEVLIDFLDPPLHEEPKLVQYAVLDLPKSTENLTEEDNTAVCARNSLGDNSHNLMQQNGDVGITYADLDVFTDGTPVDHGATYINIGPEPAKEQPVPSRMVKLRNKNLVLDHIGGAGTCNNLPTSDNRRSREAGTVNYIQLDLNRSSDNLSMCISASPTSPLSFNSFPESPCKKTESYAMIDFPRTVALSKASGTDDDGLRKTRHNSSISDL